jgi:oxygen-independent coproporphyrinogen-3 oxidase
MNRAHNATEAERAIKASQDAGFENITIDLIYGTPGLTDENWMDNLRKSVSFGVPHISCYALTVEDKTPLSGLIRSNQRAPVDENKVADQFSILAEMLPQYQYEQYEISNFARPGFRSKHNSSYWAGKPYLGFGPSAHSFNGFDTRRWNVSNNSKYIQAINNGENFFENEKLNETDRFNEFIMTRIRLTEGISLDQINLIFGTDYGDHLMNHIDQWNQEWYALQNNCIVLKNQGKIISDHLVAGLFLLKS